MIPSVPILEADAGRIETPPPGALRVLHVGKFYPPAPGGMERVVQMLCEGERALVDSRALAAHTTWRTVRESWRGVPVTRLGSLARIGSVALCPGLPFALARAERDVTVIHEPNPAALVADWLAQGDGPLVVWFHSEVLRPRWKYRLMYRRFLRRVLARAARIIVSSPRLLEGSRELDDFRAKCAVIPFGIEPGRLALTPEIAARAHSIRREHRGPIVLFVGRLVPYKGVDVLLRAMQDVHATALIVGDGPERRRLEVLASQLGIADRVRFAGRLPDAEVTACMHACDIFCLPSVTRAETFGVVQLEAMACSRPVVSTDLPTGVPWVNQHDRTGLVVPPGDAAALAAALSRLARDAALRDRLGRNGAARVAAEFTIPRMVARTTALYGEILREARAA